MAAQHCLHTLVLPSLSLSEEKPLLTSPGNDRRQKDLLADGV